MINIEQLKNEFLTIAKEKVTEETKAKAVVYIKDKWLGTLKDISNEYVLTLRSSANTKNGWCYYRDVIFLPFIIQVGLYLIEMSLDNIMEAQNEI